MTKSEAKHKRKCLLTHYLLNAPWIHFLIGATFPKKVPEKRFINLGSEAKVKAIFSLVNVSLLQKHVPEYLYATDF